MVFKFERKKPKKINENQTKDVKIETLTDLAQFI